MLFRRGGRSLGRENRAEERTRDGDDSGSTGIVKSLKKREKGSNLSIHDWSKSAEKRGNFYLLRCFCDIGCRMFLNTTNNCVYAFSK